MEPPKETEGDWYARVKQAAADAVRELELLNKTKRGKRGL